MIVPEEKKAGYITLKEAGERFGDSQDYLGQLIRKGKLEGKLVYSHVAWVTTPEAVEEYLAGAKKKKQSAPEMEAQEELELEESGSIAALETEPNLVSTLPPENVILPSLTSRMLLYFFRVFLVLIILLGVYVFYLMVAMLGSSLTAKTNVASASVMFSVPVVSPVSEHHAVALTPRHD